MLPLFFYIIAGTQFSLISGGLFWVFSKSTFLRNLNSSFGAYYSLFCVLNLTDVNWIVIVCPLAPYELFGSERDTQG